MMMSKRSKLVRVDVTLDRFIRESRIKISEIIGKDISLSETQRILAVSGTGSRICILNYGRRKRKTNIIDDMMRF